MQIACHGVCLHVVGRYLIEKRTICRGCWTTTPKSLASSAEIPAHTGHCSGELRRRCQTLTTRFQLSMEATGRLQLNLQTIGRSIPSFFIRDCNVVRLSPRCSAAPSFPKIFQSHASSTFLMCARSISSRVSPVRSWAGDGARLSPELPGNQVPSSSCGPSERIMALSIIFLNSLTLPGQL